MAEAIRSFLDWYKLGYHKMEFMVGIFASIFGGFLKYLSGSLIDMSFFGDFIEVMGRVVEAGFVALVCGICGAAGTYLWSWFKKKYLVKDKYKKRKRHY